MKPPENDWAGLVAGGIEYGDVLLDMPSSPNAPWRKCSLILARGDNMIFVLISKQRGIIDS
jgi:hypothetical protein